MYVIFYDVDCTMVPVSYGENVTKHELGRDVHSQLSHVGSSQLQHTTGRVWCKNRLEMVMRRRKPLPPAVSSVVLGPWENGKISTWEDWMGSRGLWVVKGSLFSLSAKVEEDIQRRVWGHRIFCQRQSQRQNSFAKELPKGSVEGFQDKKMKETRDSALWR